VSDKNLEKVRALVAKANSTNFEGEARVFREKAEQLIAKYGLDRSETGIDGPVLDDLMPNDYTDWLAVFMKERTEYHNDILRRGANNSFTDRQLRLAAKMREQKLPWRIIALYIGSTSPGHLSKRVREAGYL
jgi:hypothetical protein